MPKSNTAKTMVLNFLARNQSVTQPTQLYLALFSTSPTDANTGIEASYDGYQRQAVVFGNPQLSGGAAIIQNTAQLTFALVPAASGNVAHAALMTAQVGGDLVYYGPLAATYALNQGVQPIVPIGSLTISET
jgi:hypothetical protein